MLLEEAGLVREDGVAGRLEIVGGARLGVGEPAGSRREIKGRVDGDLLVGGNTPEYRSAGNADLEVDATCPPVERPLHCLDPVHATMVPGVSASGKEYARTPCCWSRCSQAHAHFCRRRCGGQKGW